MKNETKRSLIARIGGYALRAKHDPMAYTHAARSAFLLSFEKRVDPDGTLAPSERKQRALALRKAHMLQLALRRRGMR
jgi:hypothetical protein